MNRLLLLLCGVLLACASGTPAQPGWAQSQAYASEAPQRDPCVTLLCGKNACGLYRCEDVRPGRIVRAQAVAPMPVPEPMEEPFPTPATPQRYWGSAQGLPGDAEPIFIIPWNQASPEPQAVEEGGEKDTRTYVKHHVIPRMFEKWFKRKRIDIHEWTLIVERSIHQRIHAGAKGGPWNAAWKQYIDDEGERASKQDIHVFALKLILRFELSGPVVPYYRKLLPVVPIDEEDPY